MKERIALDASHLPQHGMGSASPSWWGTLAFMLIEGTGFALAIIVYLYLITLVPAWPPNPPPPDLGPGTWLTAVLIISAIPNMLVGRWAAKREMKKVRIGLVVMCAFGIAPLILRIFEFPALHVYWDDDAYGSISWVLLGLHTTHILTDLVDTMVLTVLMFTRHGNNDRRFGDVEDNAMYWNFVVITWLPIYGCIYWVTRL